MTEGSGSGIRIRLFALIRIRIRSRQFLDPDPVCPERLDPDPVNIKQDPRPCHQAKFSINAL